MDVVESTGGCGVEVAGIMPSWDTDENLLRDASVMTLVEITYELQSPLSNEQLHDLGGFANTYGLRKFRVSDERKHLTFEYDASRLKETEVSHVLRMARIPVTRKIN
jgi:hypothetical protein